MTNQDFAYYVLPSIIRHMVSIAGPTPDLGSLDLELRRGVLILATLSQLREEQYGYSLKRALGAKGLEIDEGTLYPLLRRLEGQGLLASSWRVADGRPRRYYVLSATGFAALPLLEANWRELVRIVGRLLDEEQEK